MYFLTDSCKNHHESHMTNKESVALIIKQCQERKLEIILEKLLKNKPLPVSKCFCRNVLIF